MINGTFILEDTLKLLANYQNLRCALTFYRVQENTYYLLNTIPPLRLNYYVVISNAADLLKKYSKNVLMPENSESLLESQNSRLL